MNSEGRAFSNQVVVAAILDNLTSHELLQDRLVCKLWRDEANRLIRRRQHKFFFSPLSKTRSTDGHKDLEWRQSWKNVVQMSFIYSPKRDTFIRASHRLLDLTHPSVNLEASSLDPGDLKIESDFFQELEDFYNRLTPRNCNSHCKMAGYSLDRFTDYLEYNSIYQNPGGDFDENLGHANFPFVSFRFQRGQLRDRREVSRFFGVMGGKIRYMTVDVNHMFRTAGCAADDVTRNWDHTYQIFRPVPNLQVLTLVMGSILRFHRPPPIDPEVNQFPASLPFPQGEEDEGHTGGEEEPLFHLRCLRIQGRGVHQKYSGHFARLTLLRAKGVQKVVDELGFSPCLLTFLGEVNFKADLGLNYQLDPSLALTLLPPRLPLVLPITTLSLHIFKDTPDMLKYMAQVIDLQHRPSGRGQRVKTLHLHVTTPLDRWGQNPYKSPVVPPLLRILKSLSDCLDTLCLIGGAGVFLEGLLQIQDNLYFFDESRLQNFPHVRKLLICHQNVELFNRPDFRPGTWVNGINVDLDSNSTSNTTLSKIFPQVEELILHDQYNDTREDVCLWTSFVPHPDQFGQIPQLMENQRPFIEDEVKSIKILNFGHFFPPRLLDVWKFSNLETLCMKFCNFARIAPAIWGLHSLHTLMVKNVPDHHQANGEDFLLQLETVLTGLSSNVLKECIEDLERSLLTVSEIEREEFLRGKRDAFRSRLIRNGPSILDLGHLQHLKIFISMPWTRFHLRKNMPPPIFSAVSGLLLFDLLPPSAHITVWAEAEGSGSGRLEVNPVTLERTLVNPPLHRRMLEVAVGATVTANPRVSLRTVRYVCDHPETCF